MVTLRLANQGPEGAVVVFTLAQAVYLLPWAVLAVPVATAAYPALATAHSTGDHPGYRDRLGPGRPRRAAAELPRRRRAGRGGRAGRPGSSR